MRPGTSLKSRCEDEHHMGFMGSMASRVRSLLVERLQDDRLCGYDREFQDLFGLVDHTLSTGGSNSVLILGPRGVGKSLLVQHVLAKIRDDSIIFKSDGLVVMLNGLLETDDRLALKSIARQLHLDNVVGDKVFGSFAEHLEFLMSSLKSGHRHSKPVIFVLEEFSLFCNHHNQTLLYNLFDLAQCQAAPIIVIGITAELDVIDSLEKRVKSRFNHRQISLFPEPSFDSYLGRVVTPMLTLSPDQKAWNQSLSRALSDRSVRKMFEDVHSLNNTVGFLKKFLLAVVRQAPSEADILSERFLRGVWEEMRGPGEVGLISGLNVLEVCLLIACNHLHHLYEGQPFNFEMAFHEYDKFVSRKARNLKYDRSVMLKAWESLLQLELVTPVDHRCSAAGVLSQFKLHELQVLPARLMDSIDTMPQSVKEWASFGIHS